MPHLAIGPLDTRRSLVSRICIIMIYDVYEKQNLLSTSLDLWFVLHPRAKQYTKNLIYFRIYSSNDCTYFVLIITIGIYLQKDDFILIQLSYSNSNKLTEQTNRYINKTINMYILIKLLCLYFLYCTKSLNIRYKEGERYSLKGSF